MKLKLLLTATTAVCLAWSMAVVAQPETDQQKLKDKQDQGRGQDNAPPAGKAAAQPPRAAPAPRAAPQRAAPVAPARPLVVQQTPTAPTPPPVQPKRKARRQAQSATTNSAIGKSAGAPSRNPPTATNKSTARTPQTAPRGAQTQTQGQARAPATQAARRPAPLAGWTPPPKGPTRDRSAQQWRQSHQNWDSGALWRQNPNWWRNDSGFRLFNGPRVGFFFIPEIGYIVAPQPYQTRQWHPGDYLPNWFWRYHVADYYRYGLPQPPYGCEWVWVNNDVALMDTSDGYILDIVDNIW